MMRYPAVLLSLLFVVTPLSVSAAEPDGPADASVRALAGTVTGTVINSDGDPLPGAAVRILGTAYAAQTDVNGRFTFPRVPDGTHQVEVTYIGYQGASVPVTVVPGETARLRVELTPQALTIEGVTVLGEMAQGQAKSLQRQKEAPNIQSVVSAEEIQRQPDNHAVDAVSRIPGVAIHREEGEAEEVQVRGVAPQYNSVTVNGQRVATPGSGRAPRIDVLQADLIQEIAVTKALTPEQEGDAIGGSIDFKLADAPDRPLFNVGVEGGYNDFPNYTQIVGRTNRSGRISLGRRFGQDGKIGVLASGSAMHREHGYTNQQRQYGEWADPTVPAFSMPKMVRSTDHDWRRIRYGAVANLDYEFDFDNRMHVMSNFSTFDRDQYTRYSRRRRNLNDDGTVKKYWEQMQSGPEKLDQRFYMGEAGGEHRVSVALLDWSAAYSAAERDFPRTRFDFRRDNPRLSEISEEQWYGMFPWEDRWAIDQPYLLRNVREDERHNTEGMASVLGNARVPFTFLDEQSFFKVGTKVSWRDFAHDGRHWRRFQDENKPLLTIESAGAFDPFDRILWSETPDYDEILASTYRVEREDVALRRTYSVGERIAAAYAQAEINWTSRLMTLFGARVENTHGDVFHSTTGETSRDYTDLLPSAHLVYQFTPGTQLRVAYSTGIARPDFNELAPYEFVNVDDDGVEVSVNRGNPDLVASHAQNYDLMFETYSSGLGMLSAGVFHKQIDDQLVRSGHSETRIDPATGLEQIWNFNYRVNGESAELTGGEVAITRRLDFMPGALSFLRPFIITANYTRIFSEMTLGEGEHKRTLPMIKTPPYAGNLIVTYDNPALGLESTLSWNHRGPNYERVWGARGGGKYRDRSTSEENYFDATFVKDWEGGWSTYLEIDNITKEGENSYWGFPTFDYARIRGWDWPARQFNLGFRYRH